eukprot:1142065-Pelagomonas_calceolata.AAC.3
MKTTMERCVQAAAQGEADLFCWGSEVVEGDKECNDSKMLVCVRACKAHECTQSALTGCPSSLVAIVEYYVEACRGSACACHGYFDVSWKLEET